jgi:hypothetical protein
MNHEAMKTRSGFLGSRPHPHKSPVQFMSFCFVCFCRSEYQKPLVGTFLVAHKFPTEALRHTNCIGHDSRADERALTRMGQRGAAAKPAGWPGEVRGGIFDGAEQSEYPACGGEMRMSFAPKRDLNRPMQPRSSDLPRRFARNADLALPVGGWTWGVKDG